MTKLIKAPALDHDAMMLTRYNRKVNQIMRTELQTARGRPALPPEKTQTARIHERITEVQRTEYEARGGKAWLVRELGRKARP